jgi:Putative auto-transporter adhesin, head GIN domain
MKKIFLLLICCNSLLFSACVQSIKGSGKAITKIKNVSNFNAVISDLPANINLRCIPDTAFSCTITAQENIQPYIECLIEKEELLIRFKRATNITTYQKIEINISMPTVNGLKVLGSGDGNITGKLYTQNLLCAMMGSGNINVDGATIGKLRADITGSGNITLLNTTNQKAEYAIKGSGKIDANAAPTDTVKAIVAGSGDINCMAVKILDAEINGSGNITYLGKPSVIKNKIGGNGKISGYGVLTENAK